MAVNNKCFRPIVNPQATLLILGSMPGETSLRTQQYYAHPQNSFWKIMQEISKIPATADYAERVQGLINSGMALWDVLASCQREGSLDTKIIPQSMVINDFKNFFAEHRKLQKIALNGSTAGKLFIKHVVNNNLLPENIDYEILPSSSPANARLSFAEKSQRWLAFLTGVTV